MVGRILGIGPLLLLLLSSRKISCGVGVEKKKDLEVLSLIEKNVKGREFKTRWTLALLSWLFFNPLNELTWWAAECVWEGVWVGSPKRGTLWEGLWES